MPSKTVYERFLWFHNQVKAERFPNARILAEKFELSQKTAQRDIEFMRDRMRAPLVYLPAKRGYAYEEQAYELPGIWITGEELAALFIASRLASTIPDKRLKSSFKSFLQQVVSFPNTNKPLIPMESFRSSWWRGIWRIDMGLRRKSYIGQDLQAHEEYCISP